MTAPATPEPARPVLVDEVDHLMEFTDSPRPCAVNAAPSTENGALLVDEVDQVMEFRDSSTGLSLPVPGTTAEPSPADR